MRFELRSVLVLLIVVAIIFIPAEFGARSYRTQRAAVDQLGLTDISAHWSILPPHYEVSIAMKIDSLDEKGASLLAQLPYLECLLLSGSCTGAALRVVSEHQGVEVLQLSNFHALHDDDLKYLHTMKSLKHVYLYNSEFGDDAIQALRKARPDVTVELRP